MQPARLEQGAERGRRQALAERGNHAAADENKFGLAALQRIIPSRPRSVTDAPFANAAPGQVLGSIDFE